jgi:hypothetical protein
MHKCLVGNCFTNDDEFGETHFWETISKLEWVYCSIYLLITKDFREKGLNQILSEKESPEEKNHKLILFNNKLKDDKSKMKTLSKFIVNFI